jgi:hypothetical protein
MCYYLQTSNGKLPFQTIPLQEKILRKKQQKGGYESASETRAENTIAKKKTERE